MEINVSHGEKSGRRFEWWRDFGVAFRVMKRLFLQKERLCLVVVEIKHSKATRAANMQNWCFQRREQWLRTKGNCKKALSLPREGRRAF